MIKTNIDRDKDGNLPKFAWPGGYPIFYVLEDGEVMCADCANGQNGSDAKIQDDPQWNVIAPEVNWEDPALCCSHCYARIESAYAEDEANERQHRDGI